MAFKLTKNETTTKAQLSEDITKAWAAVEDAVGVFNDEVSAAKTKVEAAITAFNEVAGQVAVFVQEVTDRATGEIDDKTDKWQESERGEAAIAWKDEWENFDGDGVENIDWPEELAIEQPTVVDLDALPEEAD